jgi:methylmalonyl-CoA mutase C-terminal domain/subunit
VIEVPVRDRDRIELGPWLALAQPGQDTGAAVEQQAPAVALEEISRLGSARVWPSRRTACDRQFHLSTTAIYLPPVARKIRVVIAKPGLDGHDRGAKIIARALRDAGMEVIYTGLHQTPEQIVETAIQEDADAVGISILSGAHMTLVPRILEGLRENGAEDVLVVVGGTIPNADADELKEQGVAAVFTPGAPTSEIVDFLRERVAA